MRLTLQTDYSLRVLLYTAAHPEEWISSRQLAELYAVSVHHMGKVTKDLVNRGYLRSRRGQTGGLQLAKAPATLNLGALIRALEPDLDLLECFDPQSKTCLLTPSCSLRHALMAAQRAFLAELDKLSIADLVADGAMFRRLFLRRDEVVRKSQSRRQTS